VRRDLHCRQPDATDRSPANAGYTVAMKVVAVRRSKLLAALLVALPIAAAGIGGSACNRTPSSEAPPAAPTAAPAHTVPAPAAAPAKPGAASAAPQIYGAPLQPDKPVELAALLANPESFRDRAITVAGQVRKACSRKGCWMELAGSTAEGTPGCRVTFKDYGFFVPTDSAGSRARVQGTVVVDTLPAATVRHYEEEGAVFPNKKSDGTAPEVRLVASGVELWRDRRTN
jgi:hypothetical protein